MALAQTSNATWQTLSFIPPLFDIHLTSEPSVSRVTKGILSQEIAGSVRLLWPQKTASRKYSVKNGLKATDGMKSTDLTVAQPAVGEHWLSVAASTLSLPEEWVHVLNEVQEYASLEAEWRGPGTLAVPEEVGKQAEVLVRQLAEILPNGHIPMVGADDEGCIVMTWSENSLLGNLSVRGKGLYSFYVRRGKKVAKAGRAEVAAPIPEELIDALRP